MAEHIYLVHGTSTDHSETPVLRTEMMKQLRGTTENLEVTLVYTDTCQRHRKSPPARLCTLQTNKQTNKGSSSLKPDPNPSILKGR